MRRRVSWFVLLIAAFAASPYGDPLPTAAHGSAAFATPLPQAICVPPPPGLVSWWDGDAVAGTAASDIHGANDGVLMSGATTAPGKVGTAFSLDGIDDYVEVPSSPELNPALITIDAWINPSSATNVEIPPIADKFSYSQSAGFRGYALGLAGTLGVSLGAADVRSLYFAVGASGGLREEVTTTATIPLNTLTHVAATYDGVDIRMYINGVEAATHVLRGFAGTGSIRATPTWLGIGAQSGSGFEHRHFEGLIDELEIHDQALSAAEVQSVYDADSAGKCKPQPEPPGSCIVPPGGMVAWWDGDAVAGTAVSDIQGANDGTLMNGASTLAGQVGEAFSFDGVDDYVDIGNPAALRITGPLTVDAWVKVAGSGSSQAPVVFGKWDDINEDTAGYTVQLIEQAGGTFTANFFISRNGRQFTWAESTTRLRRNTWYHLAGVFDGALANIYVDGVLEDSAPHSGGIFDTPAHFEIGANNDAGPRGPGLFHAFNGLIDEVEVFDRGLSSAEIQAIFDAGSAGKCKGAGNARPIAVAGPNQQVACGGPDGATVTLDGSGSNDPDGQILSYSWSEGGQQIGTGETLDVTLAEGVHTIMLTVQDDAGELGMDEVRVEVAACPVNQLPVADAGVDQQLACAGPAGTSVTLDGSNSFDPEGLPLSYSWTGGFGATNSGPTASVSLTVGVHPITLVVNDGADDSAPDEVVIDVADNTPPVLSGVPDPLIVEQEGPAGTPAGSIDLSGVTAADQCDGVLPVGSDAPGTFPPGATTVTFTATDAAGNATTGTTTVTVVDTTAPVIGGVPDPVSAEGNALGGATVSLGTPTATDVVDGSVAVTSDAPAVFALGATTVTFTATDAAGNATTGTTTVTVVDTTAPAISGVPAAVTVECSGPGGTTVPLGTPSALDIVDGALPVGSDAPASFGHGTTVVTYTATDGQGNTATATTTVAVVDATAPVIASVTASPGELWPPNHKMAPVTLSVDVSDLCDSSVSAAACQIVAVTSSEPVAGKGDKTTPDWQVTGPLTLSLRAERSGKGDRVYTITVECSDASSNASRSTVEVRVPKSQGNGR